MKKSKFYEFLKRYRFGMVFAMLGAACFSISSIFNSSIVSKVGASYICSVRFMFQGLLMTPLVLKDPELLCKPKMIDWLFAISSAILIAISGYFNYFSYVYIPIMDAAVIYNCLPVYVFIVSSIWLKEKVTYFSMFLLLIILTGVFLVCQPTFAFGQKNPADYGGLSMSWKGYLFITIASILAAVVICLVKKIESSGTVFIILIQGMFSVPVGLIISAIVNDGHDPENLTQLLYMLTGSLSSSLGRSLITLSLKFEDSTIVSMLCPTEIFFSLIFQMLVFNIYPNVPGVFGALFVLFGVIGIKLKDKLKGKWWKKNKFSQKVPAEETKPLIK